MKFKRIMLGKGGGSTIEMELQHDLKLKLHYGEYDYFALDIDCRGAQSGYSIEEVYGVLPSFFRNKIRIDV